MSDTIELCARCGAAPGPRITRWIGFTGDLKGFIQDQVCGTCWEKWQGTQLMAVNEYRLNLGRPEHRQVLADLAAEFFKFTNVAPASAEEGASLEHLGQVWSPPKQEAEQ
jgi:Fe-S cluster biosynthesis and repair protein YggX